VQLSRLVQAKLSINDSRWLNQILDRPTHFESEILLVKSNRFYLSNRLLKPKVCILCMKENGIHRDVWQHTHQLVCKTHQSSLITLCHTCQTPLKWDTALIDSRCTNEACNAALIEPRITSTTLSPNEIDDCLLVALIRKTQGKCLVQKPSYSDLKDINKTLSLNSQILNDEKLFYDQVIKPTLSNDLSTSAYPINIKLLSLSFMIKHLKDDWPALAWLKTYIQTGTNNLGNNETFPEVWMKVQDMCDVLELSRDDIKRLYKTKLLKPKVSIHFINKGSILEVSSLFNALLSHSTDMQDNFHSYAKIFINMKAYHTPIFAIIDAMLNARLSYHYCAKKTLLCSLFFDEHEITEFAKKWLLTHTETCIGLSDFISLFELDANDVDELYNEIIDINKLVKLSKLKAIVLPNYLRKLTFKN